MKNAAAFAIGMFGVLFAQTLLSAPPSPAASIRNAATLTADVGIFGPAQGQWSSYWEMVKVEKKYAGFFPFYHTVYTGPQVDSQSTQSSGNSPTKTYLIPQGFSRKPKNVYILRAYRGFSKTTCASGTCETENTVKYCMDPNDLAYLVEPASSVEQISFVPYGFINAEQKPSGLGGWIEQDESYLISSPTSDTMVWTEAQSGKRITFKKQQWLVNTLEKDCASAQ